MAEKELAPGVSDGILNGRKMAADIRRKATEELTQLKEKHEHFQPGLTIVQVG